MSVVTWFSISLVVGVLAKLVRIDSECISWLSAIFMGVVGALLGNFVSDYIGFGGLTGFDIQSLVTAYVGTVVAYAGSRALFDY